MESRDTKAMKKPYNRKLWTHKEEILLENSRLEGMSIKELCKLLDRTKPSIAKKCFELGIYKPLTMITKHLPLLKKRHTNKELSEILGISIYALKSIKTRLRKLGYILPNSSGSRYDRLPN